VSAANPRPPEHWPPESKEWLRRTLDGWPPLAEWQLERLRVLLDLSNEADHDAA
jgi:hypothetical protein